MVCKDGREYLRRPKVNGVIYEDNGVVIRSIPAVHFEQSASFNLEWNGLKLAFSGDTLPNKWWIELRTRMAVPNPEYYPTPPLQEKKIEAGADRYQTPEWIVDGFPDEANDIAKQIYSDFNKEHGTDYKFQLK